jgi:hypothetical protein
LLLALACSAAAQKDAAEKVQEGNVNNWIEYYKKQRESAASPASPSAGQNPAAEAEREKVKGKNEERSAGAAAETPGSAPATSGNVKGQR